jgi:uncharacterized protein DUF6599
MRRAEVVRYFHSGPRHRPFGAIHQRRFRLRCLASIQEFSFLLVVSCVAFLASRPVGEAQGPSVIPLVPAANWRPVSSEKLDVSSASRWGGDPAIDLEYGVASIEYRTYRLDNGLEGGGQTAGVVIEEASDTSAAYGLLTYYQTESLRPEKGVQLTVAGPDLALMARGRVFIRFIKPAGSHISADEFRALEIFVAGTRPSADAAASLPASLPAAGLVPGSEKYLLGTQAARRVLPSFRTDLIGFEQGAEVQVGSYVTGTEAPAKSRSTVLSITYPTPQIARERYSLMEKTLGINQERGRESLYAKRNGSFVFLVINGGSKAAAARLLNLFNVSEEISGIPRYPGKKSVVLQMLELILANLLLVVLLVGLAILGGVLIVLSRRMARKWFPNSEWGSPEGDRLITLNLR